MTGEVYTNLDNLELSGNLIVDGTATFTGGIEEDSDIVLANGKALQTDTTTAHTAKLKAYDVDGTAYKTFLTLTNGNTPSMAIAAPSGGTVSIDGAVIGATTAAAATVAALVATTVNGNTITTGTGVLTLAGTATVTGPSVSGTIATLAGTETLTGKTINGAIYATDNAVASATLSRTSSTTLTNVAGMVVTVVPGTYKFRVDAPCVSTANTGIKVGFKLTTTVITSGAISGKGFSAAASEMAAYSTTVTDQALWYDTAAGVDLKIELDGTLVIGTGGTMQFQMGQHTSNGDTTSIYAGAYMSFTRIA